jgi:hypothetical protein
METDKTDKMKTYWQSIIESNPDIYDELSGMELYTELAKNNFLTDTDIYFSKTTPSGGGGVNFSFGGGGNVKTKDYEINPIDMSLFKTQFPTWKEADMPKKAFTVSYAKNKPILLNWDETSNEGDITREGKVLIDTFYKDANGDIVITNWSEVNDDYYDENGNLVSEGKSIKSSTPIRLKTIGQKQNFEKKFLGKTIDELYSEVSETTKPTTKTTPKTTTQFKGVPKGGF